MKKLLMIISFCLLTGCTTKQNHQTYCIQPVPRFKIENTVPAFEKSDVEFCYEVDYKHYGLYKTKLMLYHDSSWISLGGTDGTPNQDEGWLPPNMQYVSFGFLYRENQLVIPVAFYGNDSLSTKERHCEKMSFGLENPRDYHLNLDNCVAYQATITEPTQSEELMIGALYFPKDKTDIELTEDKVKELIDQGETVLTISATLVPDTHYAPGE